MRLLERGDELAALAGSVRRAVAGRGRLVLVAGEAGIGKTSLVRSMRSELPGGVAFAQGSCEPLSVPVPLAPLRELVEGLDPGGRAPAPAGEGFALAGAVLDALAARAPAVAVVEDAHWADPLTVDVLRVLARRVEETGVVVVVTYRDDEVGANPPLGLLVGDLATAPAVRRLELRPLSGRAVDELATEHGLDGARLRHATGGNPFLVTEAIAAGGRLPASVRDAALARAGRLSRAARRAVDAAAVLGGRFEPGLLRALLGDCADAVDEALDRGVLVADGGALGFRHELIREALEQSISPPRRAELHARACAALAERPGADSARLAHHAELGGLTEQAAAYAKLAAAEAERIGALREAYLQADRALRFGHGLDASERFELLLQCSLAANFSNPQLEVAVDAAQRAVDLAGTLHDGRRRGRALMALAYARWSLEQVIEARAAAEEAVAAFEPTDDATSLAWAHATLLRMVATSFDPAEAVAMAQRARAGVARAGVEEIGVDVDISVGLARGHLGDRAALEILERAIEAAQQGGFTIRVVRGHVNLMTVAASLRAHRHVEEVAVRALPLFERIGVSELPTMAIRFARARSLLDRGRWDEALAIAARREPWWQGEYPVAASLEALIRARRGQAGAEGLLRRAAAELSAMVPVESARHGMVRLAQVESTWLRGDRPAAVTHLRSALESGTAMRFARSGGELVLWAARLGVGPECAPPPGAPAPVVFELEGDWRRAIAGWIELEAPYEAALASLRGDARAARSALATLHRLGATAAAQAFIRERTEHGDRATRGPRRSTLANPAGLTRREQEVLEALQSGASNAEIAAALHLSERTVAHHVSAILGKLGARNRYAAIEQARELALLSAPPR